MKNAEYWKKRSEEIEAQLHKKSEEYYKKAEKQFRIAEKKIADDIEKWYTRLADNNDISLAEARKFLSADELEEFKWTVEEYIQHGKENGVSSDWSKQLENASSKYHIRRLEAIQTQIQQHIELIYAGLESGLAQHLAEVYEEAYYRRIFSIQQGFGVGSTVTKLDNRRIKKALEHCWAMDGKTFSDRIWQNKTTLTNELNTILTQSIIRGENPGDYITALAKKMNTSRKNASRLIYTESAFIASQADQDCYKELGIEEFEFVATLDSHTSEICREMDGQHFPMSEYEIGINAPPLHPNCRSTTAPYFNDEFTIGEQRAARDENGNTYYVPSDMTYEEWKEKYVEKYVNSDTIKLTDDEQYALNQYLSFESYGINEKLRNGIQFSNMEKAMVDNLDSALKKMPHYEGNLSRSLYFGEPESVKAFISKLSIGDDISFKEFISTTNDSKLYNPEGEVQIFIRNAKKGRNIMAYNSAESEVLYERNSKFKVININIINGQYNVYLEEA